MNKIWLYITMLSTAVLLFVEPSLVLSEMTSAAESTVSLCLQLAGIYAVWLGILEILEQTGLSARLAKLLRPLIKKLFPHANEETQKYIAVNISSNVLGLGNAATPSGIKAMQGLDDGSGRANFSMIMLLVVNATSIQLLPTTTVSLRAAAGSASAGDIVLPTILATLTAFLTGIGLVFLCKRLFSRRT